MSNLMTPRQREEKLEQMQASRALLNTQIENNREQLKRWAELRIQGVNDATIDKLIEWGDEADRQYAVAAGHLDLAIHQLENWPG